MGIRQSLAVVAAASMLAGGAGAGEVPVIPDFDFFTPKPVPTTGLPHVGTPVHTPRNGTGGGTTAIDHATGPARDAVSMPETVGGAVVRGTATHATAVPAAGMPVQAASRAELLQLRRQVLDELERRAAGG